MNRLMCSQDPAEVESVKRELFRAGIPSEIRSNPLANALRVTRVELWVQNERDFFNASKLYSSMQARQAGRTTSQTNATPDEASGDFLEVGEPGDGASKRRPRSSKQADSTRQAEPAGIELEEASSLLEKEVDDLLERENQLTRTCDSLQCKLKESEEALARLQLELARKTESSAAAEKKQATEIAGLQSTLERERVERTRAEEQLQREKRELQAELDARNQAFKEVEQKLEAKAHQLQHQQTAVVELRKEIVLREQQRQDQERALSKARAELVVEREARVAAQDRADRALSVQQHLEKELSDRQDLRQQMHQHAASLNSLRTKLQAKRASRAELAA